MSRSRKRRNRKHRRQLGAFLKFGASLPRHRLISGRTGGAHAHRLRSLRKNARFTAGWAEPADHTTDPETRGLGASASPNTNKENT